MLDALIFLTSWSSVSPHVARRPLNRRAFLVAQWHRIPPCFRLLPSCKSQTSTVAMVKSMFHANRTNAYLSDSASLSGGKDTQSRRMVVFNQLMRWIWAGQPTLQALHFFLQVSSSSTDLWAVDLGPMEQSS